MGEWNMLELWRSMGTLCHGVVIVLGIMFARSAGVVVSRGLRYRLAREQSKAYIAETLEAFRDQLRPADDRARVDRRIGEKDFAAAMRAAKRLGNDLRSGGGAQELAAAARAGAGPAAELGGLG